MADGLNDLLEENARARADLLEAVDAIPAAVRLEPTIDGWSVKDVIVNIAAWQDGYAHALELMARGERPKVPDYEDDDIDASAGSRGGQLGADAGAVARRARTSRGGGPRPQRTRPGPLRPR
jgi:hypothetical protein